MLTNVVAMKNEKQKKEGTQEVKTDEPEQTRESELKTDYPLSEKDQVKEAEDKIRKHLNKDR